MLTKEELLTAAESARRYPHGYSRRWLAMDKMYGAHEVAGLLRAHPELLAKA